MNNTVFYTIQKRIVECSVALAVLSLCSFLFFYFWMKNHFFLKISLFRTVFINRNKKLYYFNTPYVFLRNIPLFLHILKGEISLVGLASKRIRTADLYKKTKVGLCSLYFIRKNSKSTDNSLYLCNKEYLMNQGLLYDLKIILKCIISLLYYQEIKNHKNKVCIFDISFDNLTLKTLLSKIQNNLQRDIKKSIYFINADCLNKTFDNNLYKQSLKEADYILPDGSGINMACNILNNPLIQNLNGTDLFPHICSLAQKHAFTVYLLGAKQNIAKEVKEQLLIKYPHLKIIGYNHGYFKEEDIPSLLQEINQLKPDILFVALGAPFQELFIHQYKHLLNAKLLLGVGGLLDFYSNKTKRAPLFIREIGFEWVYRMIQEPKRMWKRYLLGNPTFLYRVFLYKRKSAKKQLIDSYLQTYETSTFSYKYKNVLWNFKLNCSSFLKRVCDILISSMMLILLFPLFCIVAVLIKKESKGPIFFSQNRVGLFAQEFKMFKFRSMVINAAAMHESLQKNNESKDGVIFKMKDDPRVTKIGKFIRKSSIDELPQLYNVLKGEMSLVGPRPPLPSEVALYNIEDRKRLHMKPGITCIWQVSGRSEIPFKQQVILDKKYIKEHGFLYDLVLLLKTIPAVLFSKGSY